MNKTRQEELNKATSDMNHVFENPDLTEKMKALMVELDDAGIAFVIGISNIPLSVKDERPRAGTLTNIGQYVRKAAADELGTRKGTDTHNGLKSSIAAFASASEVLSGNFLGVPKGIMEGNPTIFAALTRAITGEEDILGGLREAMEESGGSNKCDTCTIAETCPIKDSREAICGALDAAELLKTCTRKR